MLIFDKQMKLANIYFMGRRIKALLKYCAFMLY